MLPAVYFYDVVTAVHVIGVVIAFGVWFAYPVIYLSLRENRRAMPAMLNAQSLLTRVLITPAMTVVLITGIYMASDRDYFDRVWVTVPLVILIILFGLAGAFFGPHERRAAELTRRDVEAAGEGDPQWAPDTQQVLTRIDRVGIVSALLVLTAIVFMTAKIGGY